MAAKRKAVRKNNFTGGRPPHAAGKFGLALYRARSRAGLRQSDVARLVGVQTNTVSRWEQGQFAPLAVVQSAVLNAIRAHADDVEWARQTASLDTTGGKR